MATVRVQKPVEDFEEVALLPDGSFGTFKLSDFKGKYVVLFFWPLDFTFVCPTEILAFNAVADQLSSMNCQLVGCSIDSEFTHLAWTNTPINKGGIGKVKFPIIADKTHKLAKAFGVETDDGVALRGMFIISNEGVLRQMTVNDLPVGRNAEEAVRLVQAFQFTDENGEVCPANWKPGAKTMKADPVGSQDYFKTL
jgi:alkyl hydroperoxide reductase subunit AhpC